MERAPALHFAQAAAWEVQHPAPRPPGAEEEVTEAPQPPPAFGPRGLSFSTVAKPTAPLATPPFGACISPGPLWTFKTEYLSATTMPPDTVGPVGTTQIVAVTNDRTRILTRDGVGLSRLPLSSFWAAVTIKGAAIFAFNPKVLFNRFNNRFITTSARFGELYAFPGISVSQNEGVLLGLSRFSPFTYPDSGYVIRRASDPPNTVRDIGAGSGSARQDRWGDYSAAIPIQRPTRSGL